MFARRHSQENATQAPARRIRRDLRRASLAAALALAALVGGDKTAQSQIPAGVGIDPMEVLNLQIKPNVLIVFDTSGSMSFPTDREAFQSAATGEQSRYAGDDRQSRLGQAKSVLKSVLDANRGKANFGFATYAILNSEKQLDASRGPFVYVTNQTNAGPWTGTNTFFCAGCAASQTTPAATPGTDSASVRSSFARVPDILPAGCTGTNCRYFLRSRYLRDNVSFEWNNMTAGATLNIAGGEPITCPLPPVGLFPDDPNVDADATLTDIRRPCFQHINAQPDPDVVTTFWYTGVNWTDTADNCDGAAVLSNVVACATDAVDTIKSTYLKPELPIDGSCGEAVGIPCDLTVVTSGQTGVEWNNINPAEAAAAGSSATKLGIIAAGATPIGASLATVRTDYNTIFPPLITGQKNFVIFLTDGDDTCTSQADSNAQASALYAGNCSGAGTCPSTETLVVAFSDFVTNVNSIARAGSGNVRDAFVANDTAGLTAALTSALNQVTTTGVFSASLSVTESVFEIGGVVSGVDPLDPATRYKSFVPVVVQPIFNMPGFQGSLQAFRNNGLLWNAGPKLVQRVNAACTAAPWCTFSALIGNANGDAAAVGGSTALIKRRIYTTGRNGVFSGSGQTPFGQPATTLWPPSVGTGGISPGSDIAITAANSTEGAFDPALGIRFLTYTQLQTQFKACVGSNLPAQCANDANGTLVAQREAREMILAYIAGAEVVTGAGGNPTRTGDLPGNANDNKLLFKRRQSILADSAVAQPAMIPPPLEGKPNQHQVEYELFRDGPRNNNTALDSISAGLGLRNPDKEQSQTAASQNDLNLKPRMTMVYYPSNAGLHAFRAGPCLVINATCTDTGGEELWMFIPFDQLFKLKDIMALANQQRATHQYMMTTSVRFADVFMPVAWDETSGNPDKTGLTGKWRTVIIFGRGLGGKHLTAIDVTIPQRSTRNALDSTTQAPIVLWNRGNPDTVDGTTAGTRNGFGSAQNSDYDAYLQMGQTWSTPAITRVDEAQNVTARDTDGVEFAAWVGSGYGAVAAEGSRFYELDVLNGDVIRSVDVGDRGTPLAAVPQNALVAGPSAYIETQLLSGVTGHPASVPPTLIFAPDVHGRVWRFAPDFASGNSCGTGCTLLADLGANQPLGSALALLGVNTDGTTIKPHIYGETGNDLRVTPSGTTLPLTLTPPFKIFGLRDDALVADPNAADFAAGPVTLLFAQDLPNTPSPGPGFRGTAQPATALTTTGLGRVFFVGTQFKPPAAVAGGCSSEFESIFFAVTALTGTAAYDFGGGNTGSIRLAGRLTGVYVIGDPGLGGTVMVDKGTPALPPTPPAPGLRDTSGSGTNTNVFVQETRNGTPVCRN
jgi:hypothetical protein